MKIVLAALLLIAICSSARAQTCYCTANEFGYSKAKKADTVFQLSNGKSIALCGSKDTELAPGRTFYSEFVLAACGEKSIIKFWDAVLDCQLHVHKDTLIVETLDSLPTGKNMQYKWTVWAVERVYFKNGKATKDFRVNRQIPKYNEQQIQLALKQYKQAVKTDSASDNPNRVNNVNMEIADKLLLCAISGNQQARSYLKTFNKRFGGLSGADLEWYDDVMKKLALWDTGYNPDAIKLNNSAVALITDPPVLSNKGDTSTISKIAKHGPMTVTAIPGDTTWRQLNNDSMLYEKAIGLLDKALQIDSNYFLAYMSKFMFQCHLKQYQDALETGKQLIRLGPLDGTIRYLVGMTHEIMGDTVAARSNYENALALFEKALSSMAMSNKRYSRIEVSKGMDLMMLGRIKEAHDVFQKLYDAAEERDEWEYREYLGRTRSDFMNTLKPEEPTVINIR
jgi:tetratricopeptide (TPR) repeat protein